MFEDCRRRSDLTVASRIKALIRQPVQGNPPAAALSPLLKVSIAAAGSRALELWREFTASGQRLNDSLLVSILARSAEANRLRFAEEVTEWSRSQQRMTPASYSAFMKLYAHCGHHDRAFDLYPQLCKEGFAPDPTMYGA